MNTSSLSSRDRNSLWVLLAALLLIASVTVLNSPHALASNPTAVYVDPQTVSDPTLKTGDTFAIKINATDVVRLNAFEILVAYNTSVLGFVNATEGPFFKSGGATFPDVRQNPYGVQGTLITDLLIDPTAYVNGSGVVYTINLRIMATGETSLNIGEWNSDPAAPHNYLIDVNGAPITHDSYSGYFTYAVPNLPPEASFTYTPTAPFVDDLITFNASASTDPDGTIVSYRWNFSDGSSPVIETDPIASYIYTTAGTYTVRLTVTDNGTIPLTDTTTTNITVSALPPPPVHDVSFTTVSAAITTVTVGDSISITVIVENQGDLNETFDVTIYYNNTVIETKTVTDLTSGSSKTLSITWNTTGVALGKYVIKATASTVEGETHTADNTLTASSMVTVRKLSSSLSIFVSSTTVTVGENTTISGGITPIRAGVAVTIQYSFNGGAGVTLQTVTTDSEGKYSHTWNTASLTPGNYEVKASWPGSANTLSAESEKKSITVEEASSPTPDILPYVAAAIIISVSIAVALYLIRSRKPKQA